MTMTMTAPRNPPTTESASFAFRANAADLGRMSTVAAAIRSQQTAGKPAWRGPTITDCLREALRIAADAIGRA